MNDFIFSYLDMNLTVSWLILAVIVVRLLLKRMPKSLTYIMYSLIGLKLCIPFTIDNKYSVLPGSEKILYEVVTHTSNANISELDSMSFIQSDFMMIGINILVCIWIIGIFVLFGYSIYSYLKIKKQIEVSIHIRENIYICDEIDAPFILGVFHPIIYLPSDLDETYMDAVLMHEKAHIQRKDHIWKILAYSLMIFHWINPLVWIAYLIFEKDIEMACDEKVIMDMRIADKKDYCRVLLEMSCEDQHHLLSCPLAFGEIAIKERIKNVSQYKKMSLVQPTIFVIIYLFLALLCFSSTLDHNDIITIKSAYAGDKEINIYSLHYTPIFLEGNEVSSMENDITELNVVMPFVNGFIRDDYRYYRISGYTFVGEKGKKVYINRGELNYDTRGYLKKENDSLTFMLYDTNTKTIQHTVNHLKEIIVEYYK